jgi:hypothetical protein
VAAGVRADSSGTRRAAPRCDARRVAVIEGLVREPFAEIEADIRRSEAGQKRDRSGTLTEFPA